jgi:predicted AlkP superfamily phosphohydrolase/phosphomutase/Tfp pilus assembly protein PilF
MPIAVFGGILVSLTLACGRPSPGGRVLVLAFDGMDPETVDLLLSEGKLSSFAKLRQGGAYGRLLSSKPLLSPVVWTTIATGKTPDRHGIGHFVAVDETSGENLPATSQMRRVKAIWNILSDHEKKVAVVGWWATWPAEKVSGAIVSDHLCYHVLFPQGHSGATNTQGLTHPPELFEKIAPLVRRPSDVTSEEAAPFLQLSAPEFDRPFDFRDDVAHFKWALATADTYRRVGLELWNEERPDLLMVYTEATDSVAHLFGHLFRVQGLSGELAGQQEKFGRAVEEMYLWADRTVGEYLEAMGSDTTLIVLSDHGFELGALQDDPSKTRDMRRVSERFHRLEGLLYIYGPRVKRTRLDAPEIVDVVPTILNLAGLPQARDMPGRVLKEAFHGDVPETAVATYESATAGEETVGADPVAGPEILERLRSLGYLETRSGSDSSEPPSGSGAVRSPQGERVLAAIAFEGGRYEEAAAAYARLVQTSPNDASLRASLGGALGALGRYEEAMRELDLALERDPLSVEAYHNRGVILERQGDKQAAIDEYRTALRYSPRYEPARQALVRLTGTDDARSPRSDAERRASVLAEGASQAARRGDYAEAMRQLAEAERLAPGYALVYQYQSNVAYLMGDIPAAIAALEKALALEPENALFQTNLTRLRGNAASPR